MLVGGGVEHDARVFRGVGGEHDHAGRLHVLLLLAVVVFDAGDAVAARVGEDARDIAERPQLGAALARIAQMADQRRRHRADGAAGVAPAAIGAGRAAFVVGAVDRCRHRRQRNAVRLEGVVEDRSVPERLQRRHRIVLGDREPAPFGRGVAGDADLFGDAVVVGREVVIGDRPVEPAVVLALHPEIARMQPRPVGVEVQHRAAGAPAGIPAVAGRVAAAELEARRMLEALRPQLRADEILQVPVGPEFEHHDLLAGARQHVREHRAGGTGADDHDIDFFLRCHVTTSSLRRNDNGRVPDAVQRTRCAPLPLVGRGWGWGSLLSCASRPTTTTPLPNPPPQGGRERRGRAP